MNQYWFYGMIVLAFLVIVLIYVNRPRDGSAYMRNVSRGPSPRTMVPSPHGPIQSVPRLVRAGQTSPSVDTTGGHGGSLILGLALVNQDTDSGHCHNGGDAGESVGGSCD